MFEVEADSSEGVLSEDDVIEGESEEMELFSESIESIFEELSLLLSLLDEYECRDVICTGDELEDENTDEGEMIEADEEDNEEDE